MAKRKTILYLSYDGLTDPLGESQILPYLCGLSAKGFSITIISFEKSDRFESRGTFIFDLCRKNNLTWKPLSYHKKPPVLSTLLDLFRLRRLARQLHQTEQFAIVHCRSYLTALIGLSLKRSFGMKFIFDMRGFWADERVEGGLWNLNSFLYRTIYRYFKRKEQEFVRTADAVVVLTEEAKREVLSWNAGAMVRVIPCCVDLGLFRSPAEGISQRAGLREQLGFGVDDFVLVYIGSLGTWYLYDEMVSFFRRIKKLEPSAKFLFLTPDKERVEADLDFVTRTVSREEVPAYIQTANASICFIKPSYSKKGSSATKMAEALAMGLPVITNSGWGDVAFLDDNLAGLHVVVPGKEDEVIVSILRHPDTVTPDDIFYELFSLEHGIAAYERIYVTLIQTD